MSLFIAWSAKITVVNYLGIAVNVPTEFLKDGYISMDYDGTVWAYFSKPKKDNLYWHSPLRDAADGPAGLQVYELGNYSKAIPELGDSETVGAGYWANSLVKISDCPIIKLD